MRDVLAPDENLHKPHGCTHVLQAYQSARHFSFKRLERALYVGGGVLSRLRGEVQKVVWAVDAVLQRVFSRPQHDVADVSFSAESNFTLLANLEDMVCIGFHLGACARHLGARHAAMFMLG
jgi:predicted RNA-binding protein with EMAP domain